MLTAYFDETGHAEDPKVHYTGVAGLVAPADAWRIFEERWRDTLEKAGFREPFHMKDFAHSKNQFECLKGREPERKILYKRLMEVIREADPIPIGAIVSIDDYRTLTPKQQTALGGPQRYPYYLCFQICAQGAALAAEGRPPKEKVAVVFAHNSEFSGRAKQLWNAVVSHTDLGRHLSSYSVSTPGVIVALQAADIVSYEIFHEFDGRRKNPSRAMRWGMREILKMGRTPLPRIRLLDRNELLRVVKESGCPDQTGVQELDHRQADFAMEKMMKLVIERSGLYEGDI